jgi:hypothetical protein
VVLWLKIGRMRPTCQAGRSHIGLVEPVLCATLFPHVILSMTMPYFEHNKDMHEFWSIWCFPASNVPEIVDQQNS